MSLGRGTSAAGRPEGREGLERRGVGVFVACGLVFLAAAAAPPFRTQRLPVERSAWSVRPADGAAAALESGALGGPARIRVDRAPDSFVGTATQRGLAVERGRPYVLRFALRAEPPRSIRYELKEDHAPWRVIGPSGEIEASAGWTEVSEFFLSEAREPAASLQLGLGGGVGVVEVGEVELSPKNWGVDSGAAVEAALLSSPDDRVQQVRCAGAPGALVRLVGPAVAVEQSARHRVRFRGRSDQPGAVGFRVRDADRPELTQGEARFATSVDPQTYELEFVADRSMRQGLVEFTFPAGLGELTLEDFSIRRE